jgi:hypothetical protein
MKEYNPGDFGIARFPLKNEITIFNGFGTIISVNGDYILFKDNDEYQYLISRDNFVFEKRTIKK